MSFKFNPFTGNFDQIRDPIVLIDSAGTGWTLTVNTDGALITTEVTPATPLEGNPIGLGLLFTYASDQ